ncbi:MAG: TetR/AcrR family transcriptional regulator [Mycobacteriaceae bacterium]|nr:TetR/AcrR family transcriptional regulator [Mycobacteriaceae bacterium]
MGPRERMVRSAALLIRERGAHATAISDVLEHSGAPRGSAYHYFPDGRTQLLCEAVDYAGEYVAARIVKGNSGIDVLDTLFDAYREQLLGTDFRAGCPVVAVAVEAGDPGDSVRAARLIERSASVFSRWTDLVSERLQADGVEPAHAEELAMVITAAIEGAIIVARASRDVRPLDLVHRRLRALLQENTPSERHSDDR